MDVISIIYKAHALRYTSQLVSFDIDYERLTHIYLSPGYQGSFWNGFTLGTIPFEFAQHSGLTLAEDWGDRLAFEGFRGMFFNVGYPRADEGWVEPLACPVNEIVVYYIPAERQHNWHVDMPISLPDWD